MSGKLTGKRTRDQESKNTLSEKWNSVQVVSNGRFFISYPAFLVFRLQTYQQCEETDKYEQWKNDIVVHELKLPLIGGTVVDGVTDLRRFVFIEYNNIFMFGMMCDEYVSTKQSYVAYLESTNLGIKSLTELILRSYVEFLALTTQKWILHIWAEAIDNNDKYLFRDVLRPNSTKSRDERSKWLRDYYAQILEKSGFTVSQYSWSPIFPPLPKFGKKNEQNVMEKHQKVIERVNSIINKEFNMYFKNTVCCQLSQWHEFPPLQPYNGEKSWEIFEKCKVDNNFFFSNENISFSTENGGKAATKIMCKMIRQCKGIYWTYSWKKMKTQKENIRFYKEVLNLVKFAQANNTSNATDSKKRK